MVDGKPAGRPHRPITRQESTLSRGFKVSSSLLSKKSTQNLDFLEHRFHTQ